MLGVVALLVFGVVHLLGGSGPAPKPTAAPAGAPSSGLTPTTTPSRQTAPQVVASSLHQGGTAHLKSRGKHRHRHASPSPAPTPLAAPTGPCKDGDVLITPAVRRAYAGQDVTITLDLTAKSSAACTWEVSASTVVVALTSGQDRVWSSQDCPSAIGQHSVVVRKDHITKVPIVWGGRRSSTGCAHGTLWAQPGWYHVQAAAYGAGPADDQFHLLRPPRPTVTKTPKPHHKAAHHQASTAAASPGASPSRTPSSTPTG